MARAKCLIIGAWRDSWVKPGMRVQAPEYRGQSQRRIGSICKGNGRGCKAPDNQGQSRGCDNPCITRCLGRSPVENQKWSTIAGDKDRIIIIIILRSYYISFFGVLVGHLTRSLVLCSGCIGVCVRRWSVAHVELAPEETGNCSQPKIPERPVTISNLFIIYLLFKYVR